MAHAQKGTIARSTTVSRQPVTGAVGLLLAIAAAGISVIFVLNSAAIESTSSTTTAGGQASIVDGWLPAAGQGQYDAANMGGTPLARQQAAYQGQYDPANMGGTPQALADEE